MKYILILLLLLLPFLSKGQDTLKYPKYKIVYLAKKSDLDSLWNQCLNNFLQKKDTVDFVRKVDFIKLFNDYRRGLDSISIPQYIPADNKHLLNSQ